ncbi:MAG TPA: hypothetical protein VLC09_07260, partial [Polyangiaceae bacterium]|nr:hypothetical protein [Polyangiaceae bacterium]
MASRLGWLASFGLGLGGVGAVGCSELLSDPQHFNGNAEPPGSGIPTGQGVGEACTELPCRPGLDCLQGICEPAHSLTAGSPCVIGPECQEGLACVFNTCVPTGDGAEGEACQTDLDCGSGLRCGLTGLSMVCLRAGSGDLNDACIGQSDCFQGLYCSEGVCSLPEEPVGVPLWKGETCGEPDDQNVTALFSVPGAPGVSDDADFFQLPYPNDVRLDESGHPDLTDFPTPGRELLGVDMVAAYARAIEKYTFGFSTAPAATFRFSGAIDGDSLATPEGEAPRIVLVDLDDPSGAVNRLGYEWTSGGSRTRYVCDDWVAIGVGQGGTLVPGHRYAFWLTRGLRSAEGEAIARAASFDAVIGSATPSNAALRTAHERYQPLRDYLTAHDVDPDTLLVATVFTTDDSLAPMRALASAVAAAPLPTVSDWTLCAQGVESPCPQAEGSRACGNPTVDYEEYQALVTLPIFQEGTPPYQSTGGRIRTTVQRTEQVCMSLTVPKGTAPAAGWPLVVYAHGTGGSMRSHLSDAIAGRLARTSPAFAVLGIDQVQHGPRRGSSTEDPEHLFFNFTNPDAARGNPL